MSPRFTTVAVSLVLGVTLATKADEPPRSEVQRIAEGEQGDVCIQRIRISAHFSPHSPRTTTRQQRDQVRRSLEEGVQISVDGGAPITVSTRHGGRLTAPRTGKHRVSVRGGSKITHTDSFEFADPPQLCYWYREIYDDWTCIRSKRRIATISASSARRRRGANTKRERGLRRPFTA
jgi:hypothetical protein